MKIKNSVSYIFPVYNEEEFLKKQVELFLFQVKKYKLPLTNIILVENGSTDNSWKICQQLAKNNNKIIAKRIKIGSYGLAVKHGFLSSNSRVLVLLNVDFFDINFIKNAIPLLQSFEVITGSKQHHDSKDNRKPLYKFRTKLLNLILNYVFKYPGTDTHGIKIFKNTEKLQHVINVTVAKHELFDTELLFRVSSYGRITELPVSITDLRPTRYSEIKRLKRTFIDTLRLISYSLFSKKNVTQKVLRVADDYGINPTTNQAILDLFENNQIDVISVLPNMVTKNELQKLKQTASDEQLAIHLNLVRGKPLTDPKLVSSLVTNRGEFYSLPQFLFRLILKKIDLHEVKIELQNQTTFLTNMGICPQIINSEQHTHVFTPIFKIVTQLAKKNKIRHIRGIADIENYFSWRIHKLIVFSAIILVLRVSYSDDKPVRKVVRETICHPGSNYD